MLKRRLLYMTNVKALESKALLADKILNHAYSIARNTITDKDRINETYTRRVYMKGVIMTLREAGLISWSESFILEDGVDKEFPWK